MIKISAVSYLNTLPFLYGMQADASFMQSIELSKDIPAECARKLLNNEVDLGLIPVAVIPKLNYAELHSNYCIGAVGKVESVLLLSDVPLEEIESVYLDYQSRTSVKLCQLLCERFWNIDVKFIAADSNYEKKIEGTTAGVVIGDRTFNLHRKFNYCYDLSEEWMKWKGLPFVFAAWVSNKKLSKKFIDHFNEVLSKGVQCIDESIAHYNSDRLSSERQQLYLKKFIDYDLDEQKKQGLALFLEEIKSLKTVG